MSLLHEHPLAVAIGTGITALFIGVLGGVSSAEPASSAPCSPAVTRTATATTTVTPSTSPTPAPTVTVTEQVTATVTAPVQYAGAGSGTDQGAGGGTADTGTGGGGSAVPRGARLPLRARPGRRWRRLRVSFGSVASARTLAVQSFRVVRHRVGDNSTGGDRFRLEW